MSDIPTWHERAMAHPDHQSGMISEDMLRARMGEEIADLRAEVERLNRERDEARAEAERLTRERGDEARAALRPFANMYLWPDDAGPVTAQRVRSRNGWDEAANDGESQEYWIKRGDIRAARKALEVKP